MEYIVKYHELLTAENQRQNLVSRRTLEDEFDKHIQDSLEALKHSTWDDLQVADMGSGAGLPGLILAMHCPRAKFTLIESDKKKSEFLRNTCQALELTNVQVVTRRLEELGRDQSCREQFDIVTARAVAAMNILLEYGLPLLKVGGRCWFWKGSQAEEEIRQSRSALEILGARVESVHWYRLMEDRDRALVVVVKEAPTQPEYPRRVGVPSKRPL